MATKKLPLPLSLVPEGVTLHRREGNKVITEHGQLKGGSMITEERVRQLVAGKPSMVYEVMSVFAQQAATLSLPKTIQIPEGIDRESFAKGVASGMDASMKLIQMLWDKKCPQIGALLRVEYEKAKNG